ncbi:hypothetical protein [Pararhizobium sp. DWP1-1-3]
MKTAEAAAIAINADFSEYRRGSVIVSIPIDPARVCGARFSADTFVFCLF